MALTVGEKIRAFVDVFGLGATPSFNAALKSAQTGADPVTIAKSHAQWQLYYSPTRFTKGDTPFGFVRELLDGVDFSSPIPENKAAYLAILLNDSRYRQAYFSVLDRQLAEIFMAVTDLDKNNLTPNQQAKLDFLITDKKEDVRKEAPTKALFPWLAKHLKENPEAVQSLDEILGKDLTDNFGIYLADNFKQHKIELKNLRNYDKLFQRESVKRNLGNRTWRSRLTSIWLIWCPITWLILPFTHPIPNEAVLANATAAQDPDASEARQSLAAALEQARTEAAEAKQETQQIQQQLAKTSAALEQAKAESTEAKQETQQIQALLEKAQADATQQQAQLTETKATIETVQQQLAKTSAALEQAKAEATEAKQETQQIQALLEKAQADAAQQQAQLTETKATTETVQQQLAKTSTALEQAKVEAAEAKQETQQIQALLEKAQADAAQQQAQLTETKATIETVQQQLAKTSAALEQAKAQATEAKQETQQIQALLEKAQTDAAQQQAQLTETKATTETVQQQLAKTSAVLEQARAEATEAKQETQQIQALLEKAQADAAQQQAQLTETKTTTETVQQQLAKTSAALEQARAEATEAKQETQQIQALLEKAQADAAQQQAQPTETKATTETAQQETQQPVETQQATKQRAQQTQTPSSPEPKASAQESLLHSSYDSSLSDPSIVVQPAEKLYQTESEASEDSILIGTAMQLDKSSAYDDNAEYSNSSADDSDPSIVIQAAVGIMRDKSDDLDKQGSHHKREDKVNEDSPEFPLEISYIETPLVKQRLTPYLIDLSKHIEYHLTLRQYFSDTDGKPATYTPFLFELDMGMVKQNIKGITADGKVTPKQLLVNIHQVIMAKYKYIHPTKDEVGRNHHIQHHRAYLMEVEFLRELYGELSQTQQKFSSLAKRLEAEVGSLEFPDAQTRSKPRAASQASPKPLSSPIHSLARSWGDFAAITPPHEQEKQKRRRSGSANDARRILDFKENLEPTDAAAPRGPDSPL